VGNDTKADSLPALFDLIFQALAANAARVEREAEEISIGGSLQSFTSAFNAWASALMFLIETEERLVLAPIASRSEKGGVASNVAVNQMVAAAAESRHQTLTNGLEGVLEVLNGELGRTSVIERTKQHLYGSVLALRTSQEDHMEDTRALVLPLVKAILGDAEQRQLASSLLRDGDSDDSSWFADWVAEEVDDDGRKSIAVLRMEL
jgi:hypothetical protein